MKMSRDQIRQGLEQMPIDRLLLGQSQAKERKLTKKQKAFAENLVMGKSKAAAYRDAYQSRGNPKTASRRGQELAQHGAIQAYREALETAIELERISSPARLRSLVIAELTKHATNDENSTKEKLQALKLLGTVTEVAAFTERREVVTIKASADIKAQLLESLKDVIDVQARDKSDDDSASLLAELAQAEHQSDSESAQADQLEAETAPGAAAILNSETRPEGHPPKSNETSEAPLLSNPHNQSQGDPIEEIAFTQSSKVQAIDA